MIRLPLAPKYLVNPIILILIAFIGYGFEPASSELLRYHFDQIKLGEYWRLITGNFLHTNFIHLLLNCAGVLFIWVLHAEHYTVKSYFLVLIACCLGNAVGLYFFSDMQSYVGLSGALHGVIAWGAIKDIKTGERSGEWLLIGLIVKVTFENLVGPSDSVKELIGADVAVEAHLFGLVTGLVIAAPYLYHLLIYGPDTPLWLQKKMRRTKAVNRARGLKRAERGERAGQVKRDRRAMRGRRVKSTN
ncbi:MAG: rhombosortase [Psychrosphaera sp.]|nr:rhombosortase [Psychrosphaera sp.]